jgi:hypothetical protein
LLSQLISLPKKQTEVALVMESIFLNLDRNIQHQKYSKKIKSCLTLEVSGDYEGGAHSQIFSERTQNLDHPAAWFGFEMVRQPANCFSSVVLDGVFRILLRPWLFGWATVVRQ